MKTRVVMVTFLLVLLAASCAFTDGFFAKGQRAMLDPSSQARDITEPSQKALIIHDKGMEVLVLQVSYKGDISEFAWLVPTPTKPEVTKVIEPVFHTLHSVTAPKVVYWFDADNYIHGWGPAAKFAAASNAMGGPGLPPGVKVLEEKQIGAYDIAVLKATAAGDLLKWLKDNGYQVTPEIGPVLGDYISRGWIFTAMRVHANYQDKAGKRLAEGTLQSLAFEFPSPTPVYPLKVSSLNKGNTDLLLYVISTQRVEEPLLKTECCLDYERTGLWMTMWISPPTQSRVSSESPHGPPPTPEPPWEIAQPGMPPQGRAMLTKLSATLSPADMTRDLELKPASADVPQDATPVSPPLIENIGASTLLVFGNTIAFPGSLIILGIVGLIALTPLGRKRWRVWLTTGIIVVMGSIFVYGVLETRAGMDGPERSAQYAATGITLIAILAIGVLAALVHGIRSMLRGGGNK